MTQKRPDEIHESLLNNCRGKKYFILNRTSRSQLWLANFLT